MKKRLAERQKSRDVARSMSSNHHNMNQSLSLTLNHLKGVVPSTPAHLSSDLDNNSSNPGAKESQYIQSRKQNILQKMNSSMTYGTRPIENKSQYQVQKVNNNLLVGQSNYMNGDRIGSKVNSVTTNGQGLASRIGFALSQVVQKNNTVINDDEEVKDLIQLIDELN
mmetsp:Transcript_24193/g.23775  ORF Transcript_24193/g.23775 Transcript_24193/m.23775 type:complete len:167 (-) Transcript_24193:627-1127(-)